MTKAAIKVTVLLEKSLWVGVFERSDAEGFAVARAIFGAEPTDPELYDFVSQHYYELKFTQPQQDIKLIIKRKNPKRLQREVKREMQKLVAGVPMTRAQEVLKLELEKNKKVKKSVSSAQKQAEQQHKFTLKQQKKKQKQRGH